MGFLDSLGIGGFDGGNIIWMFALAIGALLGVVVVLIVGWIVLEFLRHNVPVEIKEERNGMIKIRKDRGRFKEDKKSKRVTFKLFWNKSEHHNVTRTGIEGGKVTLYQFGDTDFVVLRVNVDKAKREGFLEPVLSMDKEAYYQAVVRDTERALKPNPLSAFLPMIGIGLVIVVYFLTVVFISKNLEEVGANLQGFGPAMVEVANTVKNVCVQDIQAVAAV